MKFNMICIKFDQKNFKKNRNFGLRGFLSFKKPKNLGFSKPFSSPGCVRHSGQTPRTAVPLRRPPYNRDTFRDLVRRLQHYFFVIYSRGAGRVSDQGGQRFVW